MKYSKYSKLNKINKFDKEKKAKVKNYGISILKSVMAFLVLSDHCFNPLSTKNKIILYINAKRILHVPTFFIISFYFMCDHLLSLYIKHLLKRIIRLLIPYIGWSIIILKINNFFNKKYNTKFTDSYEELKIQILWGHNYNYQFWFQWNLIVITIIIFIIIFIFRKYTLFVLYILLILFYFAQYSEYHYKNYFKKYPIYKGRTLGLFFESVPFSITGFILGYYKIFDILTKNKNEVLFLSLLVYKLLSDYDIFTNIKGVLYQGIKLNILSICLIFIFSLFPSDKIKNKFFSKFLISITNHTAGVYYMHLAVNNYLSVFIEANKNGTFLGLIITYIFCYYISFIGILFFRKTPLRYLFS